MKIIFLLFMELMPKVRAESNNFTEHTAMVVSCCNWLFAWNWWKIRNVDRRPWGCLSKRRYSVGNHKKTWFFLRCFDYYCTTTIVTICWTDSVKDTALLRIALSIPPWYRCKWILLRMLLIKTHGVFVCYYLARTSKKVSVQGNALCRKYYLVLREGL